jgi:hypothetical protein
MTIAEEVQKWLDDSKAKIIGNYDRDNMRASGNFAKSLRTEVKETTGRVVGLMVGSHHSLFVDQGRKAGKRPPISAILKWIDDKRIVPTDISKPSLAFLIARKIGKEGWKPKNSYPNGVISSVINQREIDKLLISLSKVASTNIRTEVWQTLG